VEVWKVEQKGAAGASGANDQHPDALAKQLLVY
jgi:hypothetical protein